MKSHPKLEPGQGARLGPGREFDRIRAIVQVLGKSAEGLGGDCGFVKLDGQYLALSTDVSVEQIHFRFDWIEPREVGWRAAAAALSDLAAVAAEPLGLLAAVTLPAAAGDAVLQELMAGIGAAADHVAVPVLGGDLSRGTDWSIAVTVLGQTEKPITRSGAEPGDRLWVTGTLGGARAALESWRRGEQPPGESRRRFAHPEPRLGAARWLAGAGAHAMIDLSDGIAGDAAHLAAASQVRLDIDLTQLPVSSAAAAEAARSGRAPGEFAAEAGEDYELLAAMPGEFDDASGLERECGLALTPIGRVSQGAGARFLLDGRTIQLVGFNHFG